MKYIITPFLMLPLCYYVLADNPSEKLPESKLSTIPEFDVSKTVAEGQLRIVPTNRRDSELPPLGLRLPVTDGLPPGTKIVRRFFNDSTQAWCLVVTHSNYLKSSPSKPVPVMTIILKVD